MKERGRRIRPQSAKERAEEAALDLLADGSVPTTFPNDLVDTDPDAYLRPSAERLRDPRTHYRPAVEDEDPREPNR